MPAFLAPTANATGAFNDSNLTVSQWDTVDEDRKHAYFTNTSSHVKALILTVFVLSSLLTTVGNGLVMIIIARIQRLRTAANLTIANLACCDFVMGCTFWTAVLRRETMLQCAVFSWYAVTTTLVSMMGLALLTINRYVAIVYPLHYYQLMPPARTGALIVACFVYCLAIGAAATIQVSFFWQPTSICVVDQVLPAGFVYFFAGHYFVIFILMTYCYTVIAKIAWAHTKRLATASDAERREMTAFHATLKMSKIILTVVGTSTTLLAPHLFHMILSHSVPFEKLQTLRV
ncbi:PREDICTED: melanopsin-like [Priapulus caudatus]|uniref:Melanopsin-like n=1 Tax=Priapulus caudatus TaxID=37621 RepID=A0ABM1DVK5_PRICU|nr:PREDICTED: melanopsin-like [Priapulus caudatus]